MMTPDRDPFGMKRLAAPAHRVPRPPAAEIRQRAGLRRRHRLLAILAGGVAAALLAVVVAFSLGSGGYALPWWDETTDPEPTRMVPPPLGSPDEQPTWDNVATTEEIWWNEPGDLEITAEDEGELDYDFSNCTFGVPDLGYQTLLVRTFGPVEDSAALSQHVAVMGFASPADATAARELISQWYAGCGETLGSEDGLHNTHSTAGVELEIPGATAAEFATARWSQQPDDEEGNFEKAVIIQKGNRIAWLISTVTGPDNNCAAEPGGPEPLCQVSRQAEAVAARLG